MQARRKTPSTNPTSFLYDGANPVCELDSNGNVTAVNTWGPAGLEARYTPSTNSTTFYAWDGSGNVSATINNIDAVTGLFTFDGYGKLTGGNTPTDPYSGYGGQWGYYTDLETGLVLCGHRFYDPNAARFLNRDPIGTAGGSNLYQYVGSSPLMGADPSGTSWLGIGGAVVGGVGGFFLSGGNPFVAFEGAVLLGSLGDALAGTPQDVIPDVVGGTAMACELGTLQPGLVAPTLAATNAAESEMPALTESAEAVEGTGDLRLFRFGDAPESVEKLAADAAKAAEDPRFGHGVSTSSVARRPAPSALMSEIQQYFPVKQTGKANHYTVYLPNPVTQEVADLFNKLFGRK